jgi:hypothetical protein
MEVWLRVALGEEERMLQQEEEMCPWQRQRQHLVSAQQEATEWLVERQLKQCSCILERKQALRARRPKESCKAPLTTPFADARLVCLDVMSCQPCSPLAGREDGSLSFLGRAGVGRGAAGRTGHL